MVSPSVKWIVSDIAWRSIPLCSQANNAISLLSILFPIALIFRDIIFALELNHFRVKVERLKGFHSFLLYQGSMIIKHVSLAVFLMLNAHY